MKKIAIVGYGRFGSLLAQFYKDKFNVNVIETQAQLAQKASQDGFTVLNLDQITDVDYIFLAVPISQLEELLVKLSKKVTNKHVVIDICSVKVYPARLMQQYLPNTQLLATHPMFGPDSAKKGLKGLQVAFCPLIIEPDNLNILTKAWQDLGVVVVTTTPDKHDEETAYSLAFTHTNARVIINMNIPDITLKTRSFKDITEVAVLAVKDTDQLFHDMLYYNPYFPQMKQRLEEATQKVSTILDQIETEQKNSGLFNK